jgi:AcrR family transcriptional regulator
MSTSFEEGGKEMPAEPLTPERRRAMTREHLLAAAEEVFARRGYHAATLEEVARTAGFTTGAIYSNFSGKEDLFLALAAARETKLIEAFAAAARPDLAPDELIGSLRSVYAGTSRDERERNWQLWNEFTLQSMRDPRARANLIEQQRAGLRLVADVVDRQCQAQRIQPPLPVELIARIYIALFTGLWQQQAIDPDALDDGAFPAALKFIADAIRDTATPPPPARRTSRAPR